MKQIMSIMIFLLLISINLKAQNNIEPNVMPLNSPFITDTPAVNLNDLDIFNRSFNDFILG